MGSQSWDLRHVGSPGEKEQDLWRDASKLGRAWNQTREGGRGEVTPGSHVEI